ncbi:MAG: c-type cytochrome [Candidatus Acidiferrales bacterium]
MRNFLLGIVLTLVVIVVAGWLVAQTGYVDFRADQRPSALETKVAMKAVDASTDRHASKASNPIPVNEENLVAGAKLYLNNCAACHGVPSNPYSEFGRSFNPPVPQFFKNPPDMSDNENFYIVQHGIRWTGMPAWDHTLNTTQTWQVVTFLSSIGKLPPAAEKILETPATPQNISK